MVTVDSTVIVDHSVVDGEVKLLKILMFATNGEKGSLRDSFVIFMPHGYKNYELLFYRTIDCIVLLISFIC
mgnify:CR=1 FL=1